MNRYQMLFQAEAAGPRGVEAQQAALDPWLQIDSDRAHVADDFMAGLFRSHVQSAFSALTGSLYKVRSQTALASSSLS